MCKAFGSSVRGMGSRGKLTNMDNERLFAGVKKATPSKLPYAERLMAAGLLTQWLKPHLAEGGDDPRTTTRGQMVEAGVPIQAVVNKSSSSSTKGGVHASMMFANEEYTKVSKTRQENKETGFTRAERSEFLKEYNNKFADLPKDLRD